MKAVMMTGAGGGLHDGGGGRAATLAAQPHLVQAGRQHAGTSH